MANFHKGYHVYLAHQESEITSINRKENGGKKNADEKPSIQPERHCRMRAKCNVPSNVLSICCVTGPLPWVV